jgi:hypothetical protein
MQHPYTHHTTHTLTYTLTHTSHHTHTHTHSHILKYTHNTLHHTQHTTHTTIHTYHTTHTHTQDCKISLFQATAFYSPSSKPTLIYSHGKGLCLCEMIGFEECKEFCGKLKLGSK